MAKYNSSDIKVEFDNSSGTLVDITAHILTSISLKKKGIWEESTPYGVANVTRLYAGMQDTDPLTVEGFYDDTATTGPHALFNAIGDTRTLKITWGGTKTSSVEMGIQDYERLTDVGKLHRYRATLLPTGGVTEA